MKKVFVMLLVFILAFTLLVGCGGSQGGNDGGEAEEQTVTIKIGHVCAPEHPCQIAFENFGERVKEKSNGSMIVEVYPSSQLGSEREMIEMTMAGSMEIFYSGSQTLGLFCDAVNFQGLPFFFTGGKPAARDFFAVYGDEIAQIFDDELGIHVVWTDNSAYGQASSKKQIVHPEDIKGVKIRTLETEMMINTYNTLGALPTPVNAAEVYTSLQQGAIDAATSNTILLDMMNWKEVSSYYLNSQMFVDMGVSFWTNEWYNSLSENQQKILDEEFPAFVKEYSELFTAAEEDIIDKLEASGIVVTRLDEDLANEWIEAVQPVYEWFRGAYGDKYPKLEEYIKAAADINANYLD